MVCSRHALWTAAITIGCLGLAGEADLHAEGPLPREVRPFLERHCYDCHAEGLSEGGLDLTTLGTDLKDAEVLRRWVRVFDRVSTGEMPPRKEASPPQAETQPFTSALGQWLTAADRVHRQVVLRRLNRVEYENTIRDLFGVRVRVQGLLPEDASAHGFDNIGEALAVSTELMQAYLEAADIALDAAFGNPKEPKWIKLKFPLIQDVQNQIGNLFRKTDDGVAMFNTGYCPSAVRSFRPMTPGTYRVRIHARAFQSDRPIVMQVHAGDVITHRRPYHLVNYFELPPDRMTVVEFVEWFDQYDTFHPKPYGTVSYAREKWEHKGPGIIIGDIEVEGPLEQWPPPSRQQLLGEVDPKNGTLADARRILSGLLPLAFRRSVPPDEIEPYASLVESALAQKRPFEESLRVGLKAILCSPEFLFLAEPTRSAGSASASVMGAEIDDFALASRLSYFLWSSMPDGELLDRAGSGDLRNPQTLRTQVERMLNDPRAAAFTENFTGQWLNLRDIDFTEPDRHLYPEFDEALKVAMLEETRRFFNEVLKNDLSLLSFIDSDWTILNERLATHYGIEGVKGLEYRKVQLPPESVRGGVLTQASVLKVTANGTNTSPVVRGVWVLENILGQPTPPPPTNVAAIEPDIRGATTVREQLDKHRNVASCAGCHRQIDPPGFALESFDVIGGWRDWYRSLGEGERVDRYIEPANNIRVRYRKGPVVDSTGMTPEGKNFQDIREFKRLLLENEEPVARCLAEKLLTYATGRGMGFSDRPAIEAIVRKNRQQNFGFRSLIHEVVQSETFRRP